MTTSQLEITNESQGVSPFQAGDHKASINRRARKHNKKQDRNDINDPQKKHHLGTVSKNILLDGLNRFHGANVTSPILSGLPAERHKPTRLCIFPPQHLRNSSWVLPWVSWRFGKIKDQEFERGHLQKFWIIFSVFLLLLTRFSVFFIISAIFFFK